MFVDAIRAMRQVLLRQRREPPRLSRTSLIVFFAIMAGLFILYVEADGRENAPYASVHFAIVGLSLLHIMWVRRFNLGLSFSFFALFFFGIFPLFEYRLGITYSGANIPSDSSYMTAAILALVSSVCFYVGYGLKRGATFHMDMLKKLHFVSKRHRQLATWTSIATIAVMSAIVVYFYEFSLYKILFRGYGEEGEQSAIGYSFVNYVARPLIFNLIFLMVLMNTRRSHVQYSKVFVLCCFALLLVSPIGVPRSLAGALYIPLVMMAFIPRYNSKYTQLCVIVFAILFLAPLADVFRFINSQHEQMDLGSNFNLEYLFSGHFDAFHNLAQVIDMKYASEGWQVVGIVLFWVPRAIWEGKPNGTAVDFADFAGLRADNISFPLPAEFYVDYGVYGVVFGMFFTGILYRIIDDFLSKPHKPGSMASYLYSLGQLEMSILGLYLLRGSVLVSFAFTVGVASTLAAIAIGNKVLKGLCLAHRSTNQCA
jgi:oligosaccharide repeat unit polymerase